MEHQDYSSFLPFFFQEPVYVVQEPGPFAFAGPEPQSEEKETLAVDHIPIFGENKKQILVLVDESDAEFMSEANEHLLINILKAVGLSVNDIALINLHKIPVTPALLPQALESIPFQTLISFGPQLKEWPVSNFFSRYTVSTDDAGRKMLLADCFSELAANPQKKRRLWLCLQQMFLG